MIENNIIMKVHMRIEESTEKLESIITLELSSHSWSGKEEKRSKE